MAFATRRRLFFTAPSTARLAGFLMTVAWLGCAKVQQVPGGGNGTGGSGTYTGPAIANLATLMVNPPTKSLPLMSDPSGQLVPATFSFTAQATYNDNTSDNATARVFWSISPRTADIANGVATVRAPGIYRVTASSGSVSASADLTATFTGTKTGPGFSASNMGKLDGGTSGSASLAYPLDGAIFPSNFGKVTFQIAKTGAQDIARLAFLGEGLDLKYYGACEATPNVGGGCYVTLDSDTTTWFVAASSQRDLTVTARLGSSTGGAVAESPAVHLAWADVPLSGGLYYWTTIGVGSIPGYTPPDTGDPRGTAVMRYNFSGDTPVRELVWTDKGSPKTVPPFGESPPALPGTDPISGRPPWGEGRCIGCHAISPDGKLMAFSIGGSDASSWGILDIASITLFDLDPTPLPVPPMQPLSAIDLLKRHRRGNFATFTTFGPKSDLMVKMYRGKLTLLQVNPPSLAIVKDDLFATATPERKSDPFWSPDGLHFVFTSYDPAQDAQNTSRFNGDTKTGGQIWAATADSMGPHDDAKLIVARQTGVTSYYPAISHDGKLLVFNQSQCSGAMNPGNYGTGACDGYDDITATLWLTDPMGGKPTPLNLANGGPGNSNSWPRWSPDNGTFRGQRLYWLAFSSRRAYGLQVNSVGTMAKPQLWFSAILVGNEFSTDPSRAPAWLPDQNLSIELPTGNHVPQWVKFVVPIQ